jgi:hypothetical protein
MWVMMSTDLSIPKTELNGGKNWLLKDSGYGDNMGVPHFFEHIDLWQATRLLAFGPVNTVSDEVQIVASVLKECIWRTQFMPHSSFSVKKEKGRRIGRYQWRQEKQDRHG